MTSAPADAFGLRIPPEWEEIDVHPRTRDAAIAASVGRRITEVPELRPHRTELVRLWRNLAAKTYDAGGRYCAIFAQPAGEGVIPGAVTVTALPAAPAEPGLSAVDAIIDQLQRSPARQGDETWQSTRIVDIEGAGPAVQVFGVEDIDLNESGYQLRCVVLSTFIPAGEHVLLVTGTSPATDLVDPLLELFGAITATLTLHTLGPEEQT